MKITPALSVLFLSLLSFACSGGGSGSAAGPAETATARLTVGSTGDSGLFSLSADLSEVRLVEVDGRRSANLLGSPTRLELVGLDGSARWIGDGSVAPGTYEALELVFDDATPEAMTAGGGAVDVSMSSTTWTAPLESDWVADGGSAEHLFLELDLSGSVAGDPAQGVVEFEPDVLTRRDVPMPIETFHGTVRSASAFEGRVTLQALLGDAPAGELDVAISAQTVLVDVDGTPFGHPDGFFASLRPNLTVLEVSGTLESFGRLGADLVRIVDQAGDAVSPDVAMEGMVLHIDREAQRFVFLIREIESGLAQARAVLAGLGNPSAIDVYHDDRTRFVGANGDPIRPDALLLGQIVDVRFRAFRAPPFVADAVRVEHRDACVEGEILSVRGLPERVLIQVGDDDVHLSDDAWDDRQVVVDLSEAELFLNLRGHPRLRGERLLEGMRIKLCGEISGTREEPVIHARRAAVQPGRLDKGTVGAASPARSRFVVLDGRLHKSFGNPVTAPPFEVVLNERARFFHDAGSATEFFRLLESLNPRKETVEVSIQGIGTGAAEEIEAYEVKAKVRKVRD